MKFNIAQPAENSTPLQNPDSSRAVAVTRAAGMVETSGHISRQVQVGDAARPTTPETPVAPGVVRTTAGDGTAYRSLSQPGVDLITVRLAGKDVQMTAAEAKRHGLLDAPAPAAPKAAAPKAAAPKVNDTDDLDTDDLDADDPDGDPLPGYEGVAPFDHATYLAQGSEINDFAEVIEESGADPAALLTETISSVIETGELPDNVADLAIAAYGEEGASEFLHDKSNMLRSLMVDAASEAKLDLYDEALVARVAADIDAHPGAIWKALTGSPGDLRAVIHSHARTR